MLLQETQGTHVEYSEVAVALERLAHLQSPSRNHLCRTGTGYDATCLEETGRNRVLETCPSLLVRLEGT